MTTDWKENVSTDTSPISRKGYVITGFTLGLFLLWAVTFPLASAVVATGKVVSTGQNKLLQHPSGGVVRTISAQDGAYLERGQLVATIEPASAIAELASLTADRNLLLAKKSRLIAVKSGTNTYEIPETVALSFTDLRGSTSAVSVSEHTGSLVYQEQEAEFNAGTQRHKSELSLLQNQFTSLEGEYFSRGNQLEQQKARLALLERQYVELEPLVENGHVAKIRLWDLESNLLQAKTEVTELEGNLDGLIGKMDEVKDQIAVTSATHEQNNSRELTDILSELASIEDRIKAARKMVDYSEIRAPVSGTLTSVTIHTIGGVVQPGATIAEVVPDNQPLQVEARLQPADIASIALKQKAEVVVTAFNRRLDDPIEGRISYVSADSQLDEATGEPFFLVRMNIFPDEGIAPRLKAGMFTEIFIQTEARSFMSYLGRPITDSFRKAFREQ